MHIFEQETLPSYGPQGPPEAILVQREEIEFFCGRTRNISFRPTTGQDMIWGNPLFRKVDPRFSHIGPSEIARPSHRVIIGTQKRKVKASQLLCSAADSLKRIMPDQGPVVSFCTRYRKAIKPGQRLIFPVYSTTPFGEIYFVRVDCFDNHDLEAIYVPFFDQTTYQPGFQQIVLLHIWSL